MAQSELRRPGFPTTMQDWMRQFMERPRRWLDDFPEESFARETWSPAVDVREEDGAYLVECDIPGVDSKDIDVTLDNGVLSIRGERKEEHREEGETWHRIERFTGSFSRRFTLPDSVDTSAAEASMNDGVLFIRIPKSEKSVGRRIDIKS
jgi:HSP20 family protein